MLENMEKVSDFIPDLGKDRLHMLAFKSYRSDFNHQMVGLIVVYQCDNLLYAVQIYGYEPEITLQRLMLMSDTLTVWFQTFTTYHTTLRIKQSLRAMEANWTSFYSHCYCLGAYKPCPSC